MHDQLEIGKPLMDDKNMKHAATPTHKVSGWPCVSKTVMIGIKAKHIVPICIYLRYPYQAMADAAKPMEKTLTIKIEAMLSLGVTIKTPMLQVRNTAKREIEKGISHFNISLPDGDFCLKLTISDTRIMAKAIVTASHMISDVWTALRHNAATRNRAANPLNTAGTKLFI